MKRKFAPVMITAAALITTVPTTQVFASEGINAETASDNITPLVINTENTQNTAQTSTEDTTQNAQAVSYTHLDVYKRQVLYRELQYHRLHLQ